MAGTTEGGRKAAETNRSKHGKDFYSQIGAIGGKVGRIGGFSNKDLAREAGRRGGLAPKRKGTKNGK